MPIFRFFVVFLLSFLLSAVAWAAPGSAEGEADRTTYLLQNSVIGAAGTRGSSTQFALGGTLGQPTPVGVGSSQNFDLYAGFWGRLWIVTSVLEGTPPETFSNALFPNIPNPFNPMTTISYEVAGPAPVEITIYSIQGRAVRTFVEGTRAPGRYQVVWDGRDERGENVGSGVYLYRLQIGPYDDVKKMVLVK
ncbi:MAG: FlgD immunoglobulin-like domain containing protein [Candidatus Eisenbacteria bacterium]